MKGLLFLIFSIIVLQAENAKTYTDKNTGLMWQNNEAVEIIQKSWMDMTTDSAKKCFYGIDQNSCSDTSGDTASTYCQKLQLDGFDDWRLPSIMELNSFLLNKPDKHIQEGTFWSATSDQYKNKPREAAHVIMYRGKDFQGTLLTRDKNTKLYVRCVRGKSLAGSLYEESPIWEILNIKQ
jgi:hypothetical protein